MTPREIVLAQIHHEETHPVPYTFGCEDAELSRQLQAHYGSEEWKKRFVPYIVHVGGIDATLQKPIDNTYARDGFGTLWRNTVGGFMTMQKSHADLMRRHGFFMACVLSLTSVRYKAG